jgi:hypothetical protein
MFGEVLFRKLSRSASFRTDFFRRSMALVKELGKTYLWVDSICIDQASATEKHHQIARMSAIYRSTYATIIALSGESTDVGLPRLGPNKQACSQATCVIDEKRLVSLMPTSSQQLWTAPWALRAWTLQEGLLSPRCIYIGNHQAYFECNTMQCSESLNETRSWVHHVDRDIESLREKLTKAKVGSGCLRYPVCNPHREKGRILHYGARLILYSYRKMTHADDGLNTFVGILQYLERLHSEGFLEELPVADLQWALLWRSQAPPTQRAGFPTWSWAGWQGGLWPMCPSNTENPRQFQPYLRVWKALEDKLVQVFTSGVFENGPLDKIAQSTSQDPEFGVSKYNQAMPDGTKLYRAETDKFLFIETIAFHFITTHEKPLTKVRESGKLSALEILIRDTMCRIEIMSTDHEIDEPARETRDAYLLLARDRSQGWICHRLLLISIC